MMRWNLVDIISVSPSKYDVVILEKILIVVNIDEHNWIDNLISILNKPYKEVFDIWKKKQNIYMIS